MSVTLKDLAKASGVSIGTVSRALNDKNEVSAKTSERIRQLAQELGYIPNRAGRALSSQKSINYVGIVIPSINAPFFDDIKSSFSPLVSLFNKKVGSKAGENKAPLRDGILPVSIQSYGHIKVCYVSFHNAGIFAKLPI